jgi:hypothetical protein
MRRTRVGRMAASGAHRGSAGGARRWTAALAATALLLAAATACGPDGTARSPGAPTGADALSERAAVLGSHMRAAIACGQPVSATAQDRAAAIEAAALDLRQRLGGAASRDAYLLALSPPGSDRGRQPARDRAAWCAARKPDIERVAQWLDGPEGAAFAAQAEAILR